MACHVRHTREGGYPEITVLREFWILDGSLRESSSDPINRPAYRQAGLGNDRC